MSRNLATNCGSLESLNRRTRCGCRPWARQMRCTELTLIPTASAMAAPVQWVAFWDGPAKVKATTRSATSEANGGMREGRVLSRHRGGDAFGAKPFLPAPDDGLGLSGSPHDLGGAVAVGGQQDDLGPPDMLLRAVPIGDNRLQLGSVGGAQFDLGSFVHSPDSHDRVRRGILKRIEMSDLAHQSLCARPEGPS